jgi:hypothetical protein
MLDSLTNEQLERDLVVYNSALSYSQMGEGKRAKSKLIWDGEDDPSPLRTLSDLKEDYTKEEIEGMEVIFERGDFYIEADIEE